MVRFLLLLIAAAALIILVLQNATPVLPLVVLGMKTQAVPLAIWLLGAIAAGVVTTLITSALFRWVGSSAVSRSPRTRPAARVRSGTGTPWTPPSWSPGGDTPRDTFRAETKTSRNVARGDDWDTPPSDEWDDWEEAPTTAARPVTPSPRTVIQEPVYDTPPYRPYGESGYEAYSSDSYRATPATDTPHYRDNEVWDDWEDDDEPEPQPPRDRPSSAPADEPVAPTRNFVEIRREPQTRYKSGTIYSYSYRPSDADAASRRDSIYERDAVESGTTDQPTPSVPARADTPPAGEEGDRPAIPEPPAQAKPGSIYDAEFRVIIPPYYPDEPQPTSEPSAVDEFFEGDDEEAEALTESPSVDDFFEEDEGDRDLASVNWARPSGGVDDGFEPDASDTDFEAPLSDGTEPWDDWEDGEEDHPTPRPPSPEGNPPLNF